MTTTHPGKTSQRRHQRWAWIVIGGLVAGLWLIGAMNSGSSSEADARDVCRQAVEDELVSPASADFSRPDVTELAGLDNAYRVAGHVDADNRMGASVRVAYECKTEHVSDGEWEIIDLHTSER